MSAFDEASAKRGGRNMASHTTFHEPCKIARSGALHETEGRCRFLIVSLNPTYQVIVGYGGLKDGSVNRTDCWRNGFSGKGFNVARRLASLGASATLLTHMNPSRIDECRSEAQALGFEVVCIPDPSPVRTCVTLLRNRSKGRATEPFDALGSMSTTELVENTPAIEGKDTHRRVMESFEKLLGSTDCLIVTGTRSPDYGRTIYADMARLAKQSGKLVVLDIKGDDLKACLSSAQNEGFMPDVIKPNLEEFVQTFGFGEGFGKGFGVGFEQGLDEDHVDDPVHILETLGCSAVITNGAKGCYVYDQGKGGELMHIDALKVRSRNTTGCGDAFTAALALSLLKGDDLAKACLEGVREGALKAQERPF